MKKNDEIEVVVAEQQGDYSSLKLLALAMAVEAYEREHHDELWAEFQEYLRKEGENNVG